MIRMVTVILKNSNKVNISKDTFLNFMKSAYKTEESIEYLIDKVADMAHLKVIGKDVTLCDPKVKYSSSLGTLYDKNLNTYYDIKIVR